MKQRCLNPNDPSYARYGGAGIAVCERWVGSFESFLSDMGERPERMTLDRIDGSNGYRPDNCRWASAPEQIRNRKPTRRLTVFNYDRPMLDWAKDCGLSSKIIAARIDSGWSPQAAITTASRKSKMERISA